MSQNLFQKIKRFYSASTFRHWTAFIIISLFAIAFILLSRIVPETMLIHDPHTNKLITHENLWHHVFRDIGIALLPIGIMSLVYEYILRQHFIDNMKRTIEKAIEDKMPPRYKHLRDSGLVDIYPDMKIDKIKDDIRESYNSELRILDIWLENLEHIEDIITNGILYKKCKLRVLLWDIKHVDVLIKRAVSLGHGKDEVYLMQRIIDNLVVLSNVLKRVRLESPTMNRGTIEVKLFCSFIGVSILSYGDVYFVGNFLRNRLSSMGTQLKLTGHHHFFYKEVDTHFESQWSDSGNVIVDENIIEEYKNYLSNYILTKMK
jgi:hypothetical protein